MQMSINEWNELKYEFPFGDKWSNPYLVISHQIITCAFLVRDKQPGTVLFLDFTLWVLYGQETQLLSTLKNFQPLLLAEGSRGSACLTLSMRMILPEQELVVKYSSQPFSKDTTCSMSWSTLPFLLWSSLFRHCFFHWLNVFSMTVRHAQGYLYVVLFH